MQSVGPQAAVMGRVVTGISGHEQAHVHATAMNWWNAAHGAAGSYEAWGVSMLVAQHA